eukprot:4498239-Pyramimonas_sp.AAC.1
MIWHKTGPREVDKDKMRTGAPGAATLHHEPNRRAQSALEPIGQNRSDRLIRDVELAMAVEVPAR